MMSSPAQDRPAVSASLSIGRPTPDTSDPGLAEAARALERGDELRAQIKAAARRLSHDVRGFLDTGKYRAMLPEAARDELAHRRGSIAPGVQRCVLLAEDDERYAANVKNMLEKTLDVHVVCVPSVEAAAEALREHAFDLAVVDVDLESGGLGMEVIELARAINPDMPAVVMSAYLPSQLPELQTAADAQAHFDKALNPSVLVETARRLLITEPPVKATAAAAR